MKLLFTFLLFFPLVISYGQDFKKADEFSSKIDSCFINSVRFSKNSGFYIKTDSLEYLHSDESYYTSSRNESYLLGENFLIGNLKIEIKRINKNYWYYSEQHDSSKLIMGHFSIHKSEIEIPKDNYQFEIFPSSLVMEDTTLYFDTLYYVQKQGEWIEQYDEFDYSGNYHNNLKDSYWDLYNIKYPIQLMNQFYYGNLLISDSTTTLRDNEIDSEQYFYGKWQIKNYLRSTNPHLIFTKNQNTSIYFKKKLYHYSNRCGVGPKPENYNWSFNKKDMTILLDNQLYKIIYNNKNKFILVEIENSK